MTAKRTLSRSTGRADIFMLIVRLFILAVARGFAQGKNNHEEELDIALHAVKKYDIAPIHIVNISNALVALLRVVNTEYDAIEKQNESVN